MKKIFVLILLMSVFLISGCSKDYDKIYNDIKNIELTNKFENDEEVEEYFKRVQNNYNNKKYLTLEKESYSVTYSNLDPTLLISSFESKLVIMYQQEENKISYALKQNDIYNYSTNQSKKNDYIRYFEGDMVYCNDYYNNTKFSYIAPEKVNFIQIIILNTTNKIGDDYFLNFLSNWNIRQIGEDKNGNIVVVREQITEGVLEVYEKYTFENEQFVEYETITYREGKFEGYVIEKYSYKKNNLKYPNFENYEYVGNINSEI